MEFLSGYAAAKAPYLTYEFEGSPRSRKKPTRSNSTSAPVTQKRSRTIPGYKHVRRNSASTSSSSSGGRFEHQAPPPHSAGWLQQASAGTETSEGGRDESADIAVASSPPDRADSAVEQHRDRHHNHPSYPPPTARCNSSNRDHGDHRMSSSHKYFQDKQLPATPRLNITPDAGARPLGTGSHSEPASARTPASATVATATHSVGNPGAVVAAVTFPPDRRAQHGTMLSAYPDGSGRMPTPGGGSSIRAESISSVSGVTTMSNRTIHSTDHTSEHRPFVVRNGRTYLADPTLPYPLPVDLEELNRQSLKTMLLMQLFGRPICSPAFANKPPPRILEVGCGSGFWSMMCYKHYEARGQHKDISFTGLDIVPLPPNASPSDGMTDLRPDKSMNWRFVQHDLRKVPFPFPDASFDLIMVKDMALTAPTSMHQTLIEEYIRLLTPGGTLEVWETDNMIRMLRPHVPDCTTTSGPTECSCADGESHAAPTMTTTATTTTTTAAADGGEEATSGMSESSNTTTAAKDKESEIGGAYIMTANTPLSTPLNNFLVEYNLWATRALEARALCATPCTAIGPLLIQEADVLTGVGSRRLAVPLSEIRWEREGVGGVVTKDGKSYIETKAIRRVGGNGGGTAPGPEKDGGSGSGGGGGGGGSRACSSSGGSRGLNPAAAALRRTALVTVVQMIQGLEPMLREASGKSQDEWDLWVGKMMNDLVRENGTSWGECLEVGAWWARKR
ncbi:hypothetical protein VTH82DRAFT_5515 [Thermothelomyces myriococcoides]